MGALAVLVVTGVLAWIELLRSWRPGAHIDPLRLVLGLAVVALAVSAVADEFGWEINHRELQITLMIEDVSTSQLWTNAHLILNHVPTAGFVFALFFFVVALVTNNDMMKRGSLTFFVILGIIGIPTYVSGTAAMWALTQPVIPGISKAVINPIATWRCGHSSDWRLPALPLGSSCGGRGIMGGFPQRRSPWLWCLPWSRLRVMTETGHRGGLINHPEIRTALDVLPTDADAGMTTRHRNR